MNSKSILLFSLLFITALLPSCDEFLLKKTVNVQYMQGELSYDPQEASFRGFVEYEIKNNQLNTLTEIYLISHQKLGLEEVRYLGEPVRFSQDFSYGIGSFRVRIPSLASGSKAKISIKFHVFGPVQEDRFSISETNVIMDARKIWLPIPFDDAPKFFYDLKVTVPEEFYPVMGAKITEESVKNGFRTTRWESENRNIFQTANLFIAKFNRIKENNVFLYSLNTNFAPLIIDTAKQTLVILASNIGPLPISEVHIINNNLQDKILEQFIDGEAMANIILLSSELTSTDLIDDDTVLNSPMPDIPRRSLLKVREIIAHEICHSYIPGVLKFDEDYALDFESLAEFMGLLVVDKIHPGVIHKFLERNRLELVNMVLAQKRQDERYRYFYGVNSLYSAFRGNDELAFSFIRLLIGKYSFTEIKRDEIILTAHEMNNLQGDKEQGTDRLVLAEVLDEWSKMDLYNSSLTFTNLTITNTVRKHTSVETRKMMVLRHNYPVDLEFQVMEWKVKSVSTNNYKVSGFGEVLIPYNPSVKLAEAKSPLEWLESKLYDNQIETEVLPQKQMFLTVLQNFYNKEKYYPKSVRFSKDITLEPGWRDFYQDRERSVEISTNISFIIDDLHDSPEETYYQVFKLLEKKPFSLGLYRIKKEKEIILFDSVIDPLF